MSALIPETDPLTPSHLESIAAQIDMLYPDRGPSFLGDFYTAHGGEGAIALLASLDSLDADVSMEFAICLMNWLREDIGKVWPKTVEQATRFAEKASEGQKKRAAYACVKALSQEQRDALFIKIEQEELTENRTAG